MAETDQSTIATCETCGMPVRVIFDADGRIVRVLAVCGHVKMPDAAEPAFDEVRDDG